MVDSARGLRSLGFFSFQAAASAAGLHHLMIRAPKQPSRSMPPGATPTSLAPARELTPKGRRTAQDYLQRILTARVYDVAKETALDPARGLSRRLGNQVLLKREDQQPVFSFKLRGAYNKMVRLPADVLARGVICASAGNHAQGVALAAKKLGANAVVVMPVTTPRLKIDAVVALGAEVVLVGDSYSDAYSHALHLQQAQALTFVHPFDDVDVIAGQGTVAMEILRQHQGPIDAVFVAVGGGGLISGVAAYIKAVRPEIRVIGVQTADSDAMAQSVQAGKRLALTDVGLFSDGTAVKPSGHRRRVCGHQRRVSRHPLRARTGGRIGRGGDQELCCGPQAERPNPRHHHMRREHELRPPAFCGRAGRVW
jgi:threonine dehydratase